MDDADLRRLRWRCRRGLLENDLVLERFLDAHGAQLSAQEVAAFEKLLDYGDKQLWDLICRRREPDDPGLVAIVELVRACRRSNEQDKTKE